MAILYKRGMSLWIALSLIFVQGQAFAQDYVFSRILNHANQVIGTNIIQEIYKIAGYDIDVVPLPGDKAIELSTSGYYDGETLRVYSFGETNPHMYRINTPLYQLHSVAITRKDRNLDIRSMEDMALYSVLQVGGVLHSRVLAESLPDVTDVDSMKNVFHLLSEGQGDVGLVGQISARALLTKNNMLDQFTIQSPPLWKQGMYHYIHPKNQNLGQKIDLIVDQLEQDGDLKTLIAKTESQYFSTLKTF